MPELSDEMLEAIRILRSDQRSKAFNDMTASNKALVERLDKKDADDATWRKEWEEKNAKSSGSAPQDSDPGVGDPGSDPTGTTGEPGAPPPPVITEPKVDDKPKRRSRWFGELDD